MFVRGTIPVPRGMIIDGDPRVQLAVISPPDPTAAITQVEVVSRYPDAADGADVVEVIAHVRRPETMVPGTQVEYQVVFHPHTPVDFELSPAVEALLETPGALRLVANDPFGHRYEADLLKKYRDEDPTIERMRSGAAVREFRVPEVLIPVTPEQGAQGTLPRMMGVNTFLKTFRDQDFFALDLHIHNAFDGKDTTVDWDEVINDLYFEKLNLRLPQGWTVVQSYENPYAGPGSNAGSMQEVPIVGAMSEGTMHLMHRQSQFSRRIVIARADAVADARVELDRGNLGFCVDGVAASGERLWSWWNEDTARFLPTNHRLPNLSGMTSAAAIDAENTAKLNGMIEQIRTGASGQFPIQAGNLGWSHPYGIAYGGMTGGERIDQIPGVDVAWSGSQNAFRYIELRSKMMTERQPFALMTSKGVPTKVEDHMILGGNAGPWLPFHLWMTFIGDDSYFDFQSAPTFQSDFVANQGKKPAYEQTLRNYRPIDLQHLIRYSGDLQTLTWLGNDSVSKFQLRQAAELFRMTHHEGALSNNGYVGGHTLRARQLHTAAFPGVGVDYRRSQAWGLHATVAAYATGDTILRARLRPWLADVSRCVQAGQSTCTGNIMASKINSFGGGQYTTRQSFEMSFLVTALESMRTTVFGSSDVEVEGLLRDTIVNAAYSTIQAPFWDPVQRGVLRVTGVGMSDMSTPDFCAQLPSNAGYGSNHVDPESPMSIWAYAYILTGDTVFLTKAAEAVGSTSNLHSELNLLGPNRLPHSAYLLAVMQSMGGGI